MLLCRSPFLATCTNLSGESVAPLHSGEFRSLLSSSRRITPPRKVRDRQTNRPWSKIRAVNGLQTNHKSNAGAMKIYLISDVHTDHEANLRWLQDLSSTKYKQHVLILAGDVTDNLEIFDSTMTLLKSKFREVFFVPGNHDLWCRRGEDNVTDSLTKLEKVTEICSSLGVITTPTNLGGVWVLPLLSWYHESFDTESDIEGYNIPPVQKACTDYSACKWPSPLDISNDSIARHIDQLNEANLDGLPDFLHSEDQVITFSHFLPRLELCPEKRMLLYPNLPKMVGSDWLETRVRSIHGQRGSATACHLFGHTHFSWDSTLDGIRYIQAPLAYPRERDRMQNGAQKELPLCIYDSERGGLLGGPFPSKWSEYYRSHKRDPDNQQLAPWVESHYHHSTSVPDTQH